MSVTRGRKKRESVNREAKAHTDPTEQTASAGLAHSRSRNDVNANGDVTLTNNPINAENPKKQKIEGKEWIADSVLAETTWLVTTHVVYFVLFIYLFILIFDLLSQLLVYVS